MTTGDILLISKDRLFSRMLYLELRALHQTVCCLSDLTLEQLKIATKAAASEENANSDDVKKTQANEKLSDAGCCKLLILDLDIVYQGLEKMLAHAEEQQLPVILFGYPDSDAMTADKLRFYDSDIYRYVFPRPFLMNQFLYCAKELLHYKEDILVRQTEAPAMKMKQHSPADDIRFNEDAHQVYYKNDLIALTPTEYEILLYLMKQRGVAVSREAIYNAVHVTKEKNGKSNSKKDSNVVDVCIRYIRAKIDDRYSIRLIETVRGVGYTILLQ